MASSKDDKNVPSTSNKSENNSNETMDTDKKEILPGFSKFEDFTKYAYKEVLEMTKLSNSLPNADKWAKFAGIPAFNNAMSEQADKIIEIMSNVMKHEGIKGNLVRRDIEEKYELLLQTNDLLLDRVNLNLDEVAGIRRNPTIEIKERPVKELSGKWNQNKFSSQTNPAIVKHIPQHISSVSNKKISPFGKSVVTEKPQIHFKDKVNNSVEPFEPRIKEKPNAKKQLAVIIEYTEFGESYSHPYGYELDLFEPKDEDLKLVKKESVRPITLTPYHYIDTIDSLNKMLKQLQLCKEIAVDLEHHSYRSFQGFTCLMQISTRYSDYVIDTLKLRSNLNILNEVFTNPNILKVFHGADSDIEWLQKDFSLYVVNMFDTHIAGKLLNLPRLSLSSLVKHFCNVDLDKAYQLADWRLRPLLPEMIEYARADTHYLLYVHDCLHNQLIEVANGSERFLRSCILQSTNLCKKVYCKPQFTDDAHLKLYQKSKKSFNNRQIWALEKLFAWRDKIARIEDESLGYILPNHMLFQISEVLPREMQGILACCNPIPPLLRQNLGEIHNIILKAREQPLVQTITEDSSTSVPKESWTKVNIESPLHCPHQLPPREEQNLPTLIGSKLNEEEEKSPLLLSTPSITVLSDSDVDENENKLNNIKNKVLSPYQRYLLVKPYMEHLTKQAEEEEAKKLKEKEDKPKESLDIKEIEMSTVERLEQLKQHFKAMDDAMAKKNAEDDDENETATKRHHDVTEEEPPEKILRFDPVPRAIRPNKHNPQKQGKKRNNKQWQHNRDAKVKQLILNSHKNQGECTIVGESSGQQSNRNPTSRNDSWKNKQNFQNKNESEEDKTESVPFDYSQVDYTQFQGGSRKNINNKKQKLQNHLNPHKGKKGHAQKRHFQRSMTSFVGKK